MSLDKFSLKYSLDLIMALLGIIAAIAVLYTFAIGRHYIIPSAILVAAVVSGNLARYGFQDQTWAKQIMFWIGFLFTSHAFFALFFSKRYREILGDAFEPACAAIVLVFTFLIVQYARKNRLFASRST